MEEAKNPSVVVVSSRLDIGGTERHLARVLPELRKHGIDVSLFVLERGGSLEQQLANEGVPVAGPDRRHSRFLNAVSAGWQFRKYFHRMRPDLVHFFLAEPYLVGSIATWGVNTTRIMSRRSLALYQRKHPMLALLERSLHRQTSALLGNSTAVVEDLIRESGERDRVALIHNGIDLPPRTTPAEQAAMRAQLGIPIDGFVLVIVANLIPYKGHADLFAALGQIKERLPQPWRLMIVGRDQGIGSRLRSDAADRGISGNLLWLDERVDAELLLSAADVSVLASHEEGFSNSLLEAMGRGIPVVATTVGGNLDAIVQGQSGFLVPMGTPAALAEAILDLADNRALRIRIGEGGRERVKTLFSLDACVRRYLNLYRGAARLHREPAQSVVDSLAAPGLEQETTTPGVPTWSMNAKSL
jgi:glycosyltransferase involved in cell wall biosynthesis